MKIGILTIVNTINYGASLQAYALQQAIRREGHTCDIIRYSCEEIVNAHDPKQNAKGKGIKSLFAPIIISIHGKIHGAFQTFEEDYCSFSDPCDASNIAEIAEKYDRIIVGSDQVWNQVITGNDKHFFLDFLKDDRMKYSYAASVGTAYFSQDVSELEALLKRFQVISVREEATAKLLRENLGREEVVADADPTILNWKNWGAFISSDNKYGDYIFLYFLPKDPALMDAIRRFAKEKGCKLVFLRRGVMKMRGIQTVTVASPIDFLNLIAHAKYVISGSFHALCFSLMFHKEFYVTSSTQKTRNGRMTDLLSSIGQIDRFVTEPEFRFVQNELDYEAIDRMLEESVKASTNTIKRICSETV